MFAPMEDLVAFEGNCSNRFKHTYEEQLLECRSRILAYSERLQLAIRIAAWLPLRDYISAMVAVAASPNDVRLDAELKEAEVRLTSPLASFALNPIAKQGHLETLLNMTCT